MKLRTNSKRLPKRIPIAKITVHIAAGLGATNGLLEMFKSMTGMQENWMVVILCTVISFVMVGFLFIADHISDSEFEFFNKIHKVFVDEHFSDVDIHGCLNHLAKEVEEIKEDPTDAFEYADVFMLLISAWRLRKAGMSDYESSVDYLLDVAKTKLEINMCRNWEKSKSGDHYQHVKELETDD